MCYLAGDSKTEFLNNIIVSSVKRSKTKWLINDTYVLDDAQMDKYFAKHHLQHAVGFLKDIRELDKIVKDLSF